LQRFLNLFIFTDAVHVSGGSSAHNQEHITVLQLQVLSTNTAASCGSIYTHIYMISVIMYIHIYVRVI